jgi:dienelactone hydrolase
VQSPAHGVVERRLMLVDRSRTTPAGPSRDEQPQRELDTLLYEPRVDGPLPLIVFAHGLNGHPRKFTRLHRAWASSGYVVAAPTFPLSNDEATGGGDLSDMGEQPGDMGFVLDVLLGADSPITVDIDAGAVGAGGLSLGGATVYGLVYDDRCRDPRIRAAMVLDGNPLGFRIDLGHGPPLLIAHADGDPALPYDAAEALFEAATIPAGLLTLRRAVHAEPYEDVDDAADEVVAAVTVAWWDRHLRADGRADQRITDAVAKAGPLAEWRR